MKAVTVKDAILSDSPTIYNLNLVHGTIAVSILNMLIIDFVAFLNVGKSMDASQVLATAKLIIADNEMKNLKPDDLKVAFSNAKKGLYGKFYDRVDGQVVFEILRDYMEERMLLSADLEISKAKIDTKPNPEGQKKVLEILKDAVKNAEGEKKEKKPIVRSERDNLIQSYFKEFDNLYKTIGFDAAGIRYIKVEDIVFDQVEYVEFKLENP